MKNFKTYLAAILFIGAISATAFALTEDDPKKQHTETTTKAHCDQVKATASVDQPCSQHKETASETNCKEKESASTSSAACPKAKECAKATASAASTAASAEKE